MASKKNKVLSKSNGHCWYCGIHITPKTMTIDHVIPQSKERNNSISNLVPCCQSCNSKKGNRSMKHFREIMGRTERYLWFSDNQKDYLLHHYNINLDDNMVEPYTFWFELGDY